MQENNISAIETLVSLFCNFYDNTPVGRKMGEIISLALSEKLSATTAEARRQHGIIHCQDTPIEQVIDAKEKYTKLKRKLPMICCATYCENGKKRSNIKSFLPFVGFDVDHITPVRVAELMELFKADQHIFFAEPSVSNRGVHFMLHVDCADWLNEKWDGKDLRPYEHVYKQAQAYVEKTFSVTVDENCSTPEHGFSICHDQTLHYKTDSVPLHIDTLSYSEARVKVVANTTPRVAEADIREQVCEVVRALVNSGTDITDGYKNYLNLGFALADALGEEGRQLYHELCCMHPDYDSADCDRQYSYCLKSHGHGITIRTFFQMAKDAGVNLSLIAKNNTHTDHVYDTNAKMPNAKNAENNVNSSIYVDNTDEMTDGRMAEVAEDTTGYTFSDKIIKDNLPDVLRVVYDLHSKSVSLRDSMLLGSLNIISGIMGAANGTAECRSGIYGIYDGRRVYANLYNIIFGDAGSEKGTLVFCKIIAKTIKDEMRRKYEAEKAKYDTAKALWEAANKKERGEEPVPPVYRDIFVPGNSSSSAIYHAIDDNGGYGVLFETEADTVTNMLNSDYGNYNDLLRKTHHHETISMNRTTDKVRIEVEEPRLSVLLTCTPGQLVDLFPSFENGLGSRFLFKQNPDEKVEFHDVFAYDESPLDDIYKKLSDKILPLYHAMLQRTDHPIQFVLSDRQKQEFLDTYSGILSEQFKMLGKGISAFIFRIALECFRYAMILTTLRRLDEWQKAFDISNPEQESIFKEEENALVCDERDFCTAMTIIGCLINHTARVYAVLAKENDNPFVMKGIKFKQNELNVYKALPAGEFTTAEFIAIAAKEKVVERTAQRMLSTFANVYRIVNPIKRGVYSKCELKTE